MTYTGGYSPSKTFENVPSPKNRSLKKPDLNASAERDRTIIDAIEDGYIETNLQGKIVFCNDSFCRILRYSMEELLVMGYKDYVAESMQDAVYKVYNEVYRSGIPHKGFFYEIVRKDGARRVIENSISLIRDARGRTGFRCIVRDITDRKRIEEDLERHRRRLQAIFGSVKDIIMTVDSNMVLIEANNSLESICGLSPQEVIGRPLAEIKPKCSRNCLEVIKNALGGAMVQECLIKCNHCRRPQQSVIITSSQLMNRDENFVGLVLVIRDITRLSNLEKELGERHKFHHIIGKSGKMQEIYGILDDLANLETTVLITGESGTGKSMVAKALHYSGYRASKPIVTVNCSALPENLLESELFGHVRGSFTGAIKDTQGRFQTAQGGTILLDEIGDISPRIQLKLLRVLQDKEFERVGESIPIKMDTRVIACTNKDLKEKVRLGEFREDLYYRLKVLELRMPPLRERMEDIPLLSEHFCSNFNKSFQKNISGLSDDVMHVFMNYRWPGNVRELSHSIEHAFVLCHGRIITMDNMPLEIRESASMGRDVRDKSPAEDSEDLLTALNKAGWNKAKAARLLGIDRSTLYRKMRKYRLAAPVD
ncbi:MAG: sigma 54-interacting transcriptional regulator [Deltaproteobacteria bacterium]|nr:sigma 54-interacting transcriptional regulator [Deltaproteobacteria bacterium]